MKIAITATGPTLDAAVDPRFGRCPYFLVVDTETMSAEGIDNANAALGSGAGIQSAQLMADRGVQAVLTGNCGPNAHATLSAAGIGVIVGCSGAVREVVEQFKAGGLAPAAEPNVTGHFGLGAGPNPQQPPASGGGGRGMGGGGGRGGGGGGGRGMGGGGGGGGGRGMGGGGGGRGR